MIDFKKLILSLLPETPILNPSEGLGLDLLLDGFTEVWRQVYENIAKYGNILRPQYTAFLDLLEREYGIIPNSLLTEVFRRNYLDSVANKVLQYGSIDDINSALAISGFTDLQVFENDPPIDLSGLVTITYLCYFGDTNAYMGEPTAMCGKDLGGNAGYFIVANSVGDYIEYNFPADSNLWPAIFTLARAKFNWPIITTILIDLYKAGNIKLYHDYRLESFQDYSGNNNTGIPSSSITVDDTGVLFSNLIDEKISVAATNDLTFSAHDFSAIAKIDGVYHDPEISFATGLDQSGVHNIPASIEINSIAKTPIFRYSGKHADANELAPWVYGETLEDTGTPLTSLNEGSPCLGYYDDSFICDNDGYEATTGTPGDVTTEDIVINILFKVSATTSTLLLLYKFSSSQGYQVYTSANTLKFYMDDGGAGSIQVVSATLTPGQWVFASIFVDRSGSAAIYINGQLSGSPVVVSGHSGSLTNAGHLSIGSVDDGSSSFDSNIAYVDMRMHAAWLDTHLQTSLASEIFNRVIGVYPQYFDGASVTVTADNNTAGCFLDKYNGSIYEMYRVGRYWIRYNQIKDSLGAINGILIEKPSTNLMEESVDLSAWTLDNGVESLEVEETPDKEDSVYGIIADSGTNEVYAARGYSRAVGNFTISAYIKPGTTDFIALTSSNPSGNEPLAYFNVVTGEVGTTAYCTARIVGPYVNGFYRCIITFESSSTSGIMYLYPTDANGSLDCTGDASNINCYAWGMQAEQLDHETSYIPTAGATQTRAKDSLSYVSASIIDADYTVTASCLIVPQNDGSDLSTFDDKHILTLKGPSGNTVCKIDPANDRAPIYSYSDAVSPVTGTIPLNDGERQFLQFNSASQNGKLLLDNVLDINVDDVTDPYNDHDTLYVSADETDSNQFGGLIKNIVLHKEQIDYQLIGQPIIDKRSAQNDGWAISAIGQKIFLKIKDQYCSVGDFVDDAITTIGFSVANSSHIDIYVDGYITQYGSRLYDTKIMQNSAALSVGNNILSPGALSFDGLSATNILLDVVLTADIALDIYTNSLSIVNTYALEPGTVDENQFDKLRKVILSKKPMGTWCLAFVILS